MHALKKKKKKKKKKKSSREKSTIDACAMRGTHQD